MHLWPRGQPFSHSLLSLPGWILYRHAKASDGTTPLTGPPLALASAPSLAQTPSLVQCPSPEATTDFS